MPDWFYRTVSRPVLFRCRPSAARDFALGFMGVLCRLPLGPAVIDFLGHMRPTRGWRGTHLGVDLPGAGRHRAGPGRARGRPAGAGALRRRLPRGRPGDARRRRRGRAAANAAPTSRRSGGPSRPPRSPSMRRWPGCARSRGAGARSSSTSPPATATPEQAAVEYGPRRRQARRGRRRAGPAEPGRGGRGGWSVEAWRSTCSADRRRHLSRPVLVAVPADLDAALVETLHRRGRRGRRRGRRHRGQHPGRAGGRVYGLPALALALEQTRRVRRRWPGLFVLAGGGVHEPEHALEMLQGRGRPGQHRHGADLHRPRPAQAHQRGGPVRRAARRAEPPSDDAVHRARVVLDDADGRGPADRQRAGAGHRGHAGRPALRRDVRRHDADGTGRGQPAAAGVPGPRPRQPGRARWSRWA